MSDTKVIERIYPTKKVDTEKCCDIIKEEVDKYLGEDDMSNIFKLCETDKPATYSVILVMLLVTNYIMEPITR